eukprot:12167661-Ditylum_brightwellii.AAC.1
MPSTPEGREMIDDEGKSEEGFSHITSSSKVGDQSKEMNMKKVDIQAIVDKIELHKDAMTVEICQCKELMLSQIKLLHIELFAMKMLHLELL